MNFDDLKFKELMLKAIANDSRAEFARRCGITPQHLSRLMSDKNNVQPSKTTLKKIADNSSISYEELLAACGYVASPEVARNSMEMKDRAQTNAKDMITGFRELTKNTHIYHSMEDFLDDYQMMYSTEDMIFHLGKKEEYLGDSYKNAEYYVKATGTFKSSIKECKTFFVIYFCETKGGKYIITNVSLSGDDLLEAGVVSTQIADQMYEDGEDITTLPYLFQIRTITGTKSVEERLLDAIFGNYDPKVVPYTIIGFGFDLNECPANFVTFMENHKKSFCKDATTTELYNKIVTGGENPEMVLASFEDPRSVCSGYGATISLIMREETDIPFEYIVDDDNSKAHVMVPDEIKNKTGIKELKDTVHEYAKELGLKEYGECIALRSIQRDLNRVYKVEED